MKFFSWLQSIDRRLVYVALVVVLSIPFIIDYQMRVYPAEYPTRFYDGIQKIADDNAVARENGGREKIVLLLSNWGPGTAGENEPQFIAVVRHLLRERIKFVFLCSVVDPTVHDTAMVAFEKAKEKEVVRARRRGAPIPTWTYGEDYLDFGFRNAPVFTPLAMTIVSNSRQFFAQDYVNKKDLTDDESFPLLKNFQSMDDVAALVIVSAADEAKDVCGLVKPDYPDLKVASATMGIVANDLYPYVRSGQMFGLLNSARGALEYNALLSPEEPPSQPVDRSMSLGKVFLLILVILGNISFIAVKWGERTGRLTPDDPRKIKPPMPPLPKGLLYGLFGAFILLMVFTSVVEIRKATTAQTLPRARVAQVADDPDGSYDKTERVGIAELEAEVIDEAQAKHDSIQESQAHAAAKARFTQLIEQRAGEFLAVILTFGVLAFLLGDNRFYRFFESIIVGGSMAFMLLAVPDIIGADCIKPAWAAITQTPLPGRNAAPGLLNVLWLLLFIPGALWYFTYSKKYRWLNQLIVALIIGLVLGNEFGKQAGIVLPQVFDTMRPVWPLNNIENIENLVFVLIAVLSLLYFVFSFRPKGTPGNSLLTTGRLAMMLGFGVMFGNTVNTRLSWLAPRLELILEKWLGKLFGA